MNFIWQTDNLTNIFTTRIYIPKRRSWKHIILPIKKTQSKEGYSMYYMYSHASRILLLVQGRKYATMLIMHTIGLLSNRIIPTIMSIDYSEVSVNHILLISKGVMTQWLLGFTWRQNPGHHKTVCALTQHLMLKVTNMTHC